jgi:hypothetical protein
MSTRAAIIFGLAGVSSRQPLAAQMFTRSSAYDHAQGIAPNPNFDRRGADVLAVSEDFHCRLGAKAHARSPKILDFFHGNVCATIDHSE